MFDNLLGGKFSKKCKHCLKCISSRIVLIRRKKQATVKFLKKDVADLLANGHDSNAFGRIEGLIIEMNHASCYDMIEKYCQCILDQLPCLQKQRECPEEATEAIATLIFAAARFSDLPELFDLRRVFTERYGNHFEPYVNAEFAEKMQKKSFSTDRKIQLMQDIAEEFSVSWDSKAFRQRQTNPAPSFDQSKNSRGRAVLNAGGSFNSRKEVILNADAAVSRRAETFRISSAAISDRDRSVLNPGGSFNGRREVILNGDVAMNVKAEAVISSSATVNGRDRVVLNGGGGSFNGRNETALNAVGSFNGKKEIVFDADTTVNGKKEMGIDPSPDFNGRNGAVFGGKKISLCKDSGEPPPVRFLQKQEVQPEPRDVHVVPSANGRPHEIAGRTKKVHATVEVTENVKTEYIERTQTTASLNGILRDARNRSPITQEEPGLMGLEKQSVAPVTSRDVEAVNMIPSYSKLKGSTNGIGGADCAPVYDDLPGAETVMEPAAAKERTALPVKSKWDVRPMTMIPPPYTKPNFKKPSIPSDDTKVTDVSIGIVGMDNYETCNGGEKGRPVSVRKRVLKPRLPTETTNAIDDARHMSQSPTRRCKDDRRVIDDETYGEVNFERYQRKAIDEEIHGRGKHGSRRSTAKYDNVRDEEEAAMDRLLVHYSKKETTIDWSRRERRTKAPPEELVIETGRAFREHYDDQVSHGSGRTTAESARFHPERVASLPTVPIVDDGVSKGRAHATSRRADFLHRSPHDYDDLTARFMALKYS